MNKYMISGKEVAGRGEQRSYHFRKMMNTGGKQASSLGEDTIVGSWLGFDVVIVVL